MVEFGIDNYTSLDDMPGDKPGYAQRPMIVFQGDLF